MLAEKSVLRDIHLVAVLRLEHLSSVDIQHVQAGAAHRRRAIVGDIEVERPIAVDVRQRHRHAAELADQSRISDLLEMALPIVEVKSVLECGCSFRVLTSSGGHEQVRMTVAIGIEKDGADILRDAVLRQQLLVAPGEASVGLLNQNRAGLILGAADEDVVQPIAVDIGDGHQRSFGRKHLRHQTLTIEVHVIVFVVNERKFRPIGDVRHQLSNRLRRRRASGRRS